MAVNYASPVPMLNRLVFKGEVGLFGELSTAFAGRAASFAGLATTS